MCRRGDSWGHNRDHGLGSKAYHSYEGRSKVMAHARYRLVVGGVRIGLFPLLTNIRNNGEVINIAEINVATNRKKLVRIFLSENYNIRENLVGKWNDDEEHWESFFRKPILGRLHNISWRFAKDRLADVVFLHRAGLSNNTIKFMV